MGSSWLQTLFTDDEEDSHLKESNEPRNVPTSAELDSFLANSMLKLTLEKREKVFEEINGIPQSNCEDDAAVRVWLYDLEYSINSIKRGTAYEVAELMDRQYVTSRDFRMMFLRSTRYDPQAAAEQMVKFFDLKRSLFGPFKLVKKITLADLNEDEINYLQSGSFQILPSPDSAGRKLLLLTHWVREFKCPDNEIRARFYVLQCLAESQETQLTGITLVIHSLASSHKKSNTGVLWNFPIFYASIHMCNSANSSFYVLNSKAIYRLPQMMRSRVRIHHGSYEDIRAILSRHGIPCHFVPVSAEDFPSKTCNEQWFEQRCRIELDNDALSTVMKPNGFTDKDVLFGHTKRNHVGNVHFQNIIVAETESYEVANKRSKTLIAKSIIGRVKSAGGRFLKEAGSGEWKEVSDLEAREKVSKTFRNARRRS